MNVDEHGSPIEYNYDLIPEQNKKNLASIAFHAFQEFMERPDAETILAATKARLQQEGSTLLDRCKV
jgi:hypothetical protein